MENSKPVAISGEDLAALERLEASKNLEPPMDMHKFQSAQRLASVFLSNKDFANCVRVCAVLERWVLQAKSLKPPLPASQLCKVDLWQFLTQIQCLLAIDAEANEARILACSKALLAVLRQQQEQGSIDATTLRATTVKFRTMLWQSKGVTLQEQLFAVPLFTNVAEDAAPFTKMLPVLIQRLRAKKLQCAEKQEELLAACQLFGVSPGFEFALWVYECTKSCELLCAMAQTEKEFLFAAHCCDKQLEWQAASETCVRGLLALERNAASALLSFHVKNLSLQPGKRDKVLLLSQRVLTDARLEYYAELELAMFAQFRKVQDFCAAHAPPDRALEPNLHARALHMLGEYAKAWEVLQTIASRDLFLECMLLAELGSDDGDARRIKPRAKELLATRGQEPEVKAWLMLHGFHYDDFKAMGSVPARLIQTHANSIHDAMQALIQALDELKDGRKVTAASGEEKGEFQALQALLQVLQGLGELCQQQGLSSQARYFYSKALLVAESRKLLHGEVKRITDKLDVLAVLEGKEPRTAAARESKATEDAIEMHFTQLHLAETKQQVYPATSTVPEFLRSCRYECAKILYHQQAYSACFDMLEAEQELPPGDTLKVKAFLRQTESNISSKKLNEFIQSSILGADVVTLTQCYQYLLVNANKLAVEERAYLVNNSVGLAARVEQRQGEWSANAKEGGLTIKQAAKQQRTAVKAGLDANWTVCTLYFGDEEGEAVYLCRTERTRDFVFRMEHEGGRAALRELLEEFQSIMAKNADQLENCTVEFAKSRSQRAKDKWWNDRFELDAELDEWLQRFQRNVLGWRSVFLRGQCVQAKPVAAVEALLQELEGEERDLACVCLYSGLSPGLIANALVECVPSKTAEWAQNASLQAVCEDVAQYGPVLLCLSGTLQQIPFESLPCMQQQRVSRIPSLTFALNARKPSVPTGGRNTALNLSYVVDPDGTLKRTQDALRERLEEMRDLGMCKEGILGEEGGGGGDVAQAFRRYLEESTLVLYCGHGCGEQFVDPRKCENSGGEKWAPVILMGCSSAARKPMGIYEPNGKVVDAYMQRSPLVVGTLWNVSDVDIDRFTLAMLDGIKEGEGDLIHLVSRARHACKLRKLVGAAPVCFGVPWLVQ